MDPTVIALGLGALLFLLKSKASKGAGGGGGGDLPEPPGPSPGGGDKPVPGDSPTPGNKKVPKTKPGGKRFGEVTKDYAIPADWDPVRGLFFSPDCRVVVEAPGWLCGVNEQGVINLYGVPGPHGFEDCRSIERNTYDKTMAVDRNGAMGYITHLIGKDLDPNDIAWMILEEAAPACWNMPQSKWPDGLVYWWNYLLERLSTIYEDETGIHFDPYA